MRPRLGSVSHPCCFRPARSIRSLTIEHPTRMRIPSDRREPRDLSYYPARTCGELAEPIGISGFGSPVGFGGLLNCLTPGESDPYSRSLSDPFRLIHLRTLFALSHATARSKPCVFSRLRTLLRVVCISIIPRHLAVLCFHTLTHSFARLKMSTPLFSSIPALFAQNMGVGEGGTLLRIRSRDADPEKCNTEGPLKFCLAGFVFPVSPAPCYISSLLAAYPPGGLVHA